MSAGKRKSLEVFTDVELRQEVRRWLARLGWSLNPGSRSRPRWYRSEITDKIVNAGPGWKPGMPL